MEVTFNIDFKVHSGQQLFILGSVSEIGAWDESKALALSSFGNGCCKRTVNIKSKTKLEYRYFLKNKDSNIYYEEGSIRVLTYTKDTKKILVKDFWKVYEKDNKVYSSSLFTNVLYKRLKANTKNNDLQEGYLRLQIYAPQVKPTSNLYVVGNQRLLADWSEQHAVVMNDFNYPLWYVDFPINKLEFPLEYKYLLKDAETGELQKWEEGCNRKILQSISKEFNKIIYTDENLHIYDELWRGSGVSIPIFSLRTYNSYGVGEFLDLKHMVDWVVQVRMKIIQVLPFNDTTITHTWRDSYPYRPISVFALHPMYLNIRKLGRMSLEEIEKYEDEKTELNSSRFIDYEAVNRQKMKYICKFFSKQKATFFKKTDFIDFFAKNKYWLQPYALFCYFRDKNNTADFSNWGKYAKYDEKKITKLLCSQNKEYDKIALHYYIQYNLDKQLKEAVLYARSKGVVIKGDIPIGVGGQSVDAWIFPHFFNMDKSAGAPPDDFSLKGQNWGFPTYNWDAMVKDNFQWWKLRLHKMDDFFDLYRIDHVLGFFRIWEIPKDVIWGSLGYFNKALPYSVEELKERGIGFDKDYYCKPYISKHILNEFFSKHSVDEKNKYFNIKDDKTYEFKDQFNTQKKIKEYFENKSELSDNECNIYDILMRLHAEVLFVADTKNPKLFHPNIALHKTCFYRNMSDDEKHSLDKVYDEFFYHRHNDFWRHNAMEKLAKIVDATDMLACGEDLGMIPQCVPDVMNRLKILSLEIQRMPKDPHLKFGNPANAPYLSVCTTSTHDMPTIREWWEENYDNSQTFFNINLGESGKAPLFAEPWLCKKILLQHLKSSAMLTIFPLQDILAVDEELRHYSAENERINDPGNPDHYWCYRMHLNIEYLKNAKGFNANLSKIIEESGR